MPEIKTPQDRLIFALDFPDSENALGYVKQLRGVVSFYKVGWELFVAEGMKIVRELKELGHKVFLDLKFQEDVDETIKGYLQIAIREKVDFVTLHGNGKIFATAKRVKGESPIKILSLTLLSNMDTDDMRDNYMIQNGSAEAFPFVTPEQYVSWRAGRTLDAGGDGLIASGRFVKLLRDEYKDKQPLLVVPGIRPLSSSHDEHKQVLTPREAILAGADYLVVGRPIRNAENAIEATNRIIEEIAEAEQTVSI